MNLIPIPVTPSKYWFLAVVFPAVYWLKKAPMTSFMLDWARRVWRVLWSNEMLIEEQARGREREAERQRFQESIRRLTEDIRKLETDKADSRQKADEEVASIRQDLKQEREGKLATQRSLRKEQEENAELRSVHHKTVTEAGTLRRQLEVKESEVKAARNDLKQLRTKFDEVTVLLDTRTRELKGAQAFLTKADTLSGAEVITLVEALNAEIMQTSAFISDSFDFARQPEHATEMKEAGTRISELMGTTMTNLLSTVQHSSDPLLVQIALQGATVEFSRWIVMTWDFDSLQAEHPLAEIYNDIRNTETQAVGGRWRALTRAHAQRVALQEADLHSTMVTHISDTLVIIMVAAGCTKSYEDAYKEFTQKFGERVSNIVKIAVQLNKAMGEEVTSADLWPTHASTGVAFDSTTMENFECQESDLAGKPILCTTALGLFRSEKVIVGDKVEFKDGTLLKTKVALASVAEGLEREEASF